jgi:RNA polymerase sigma factor (sigma-70 family)
MFEPVADAASIEAFRLGHPATLRKIYEALAPTVHGYLLRRLRSPADAADLTQDVFVVAFSEAARGRFSGTSNIQSFVIGIARNRLLHHLRNIRRRAELRSTAGLDCDEGVSSGLVDAVVEREVSEIVDKYLDGLGPRERSFFQRHLIERPPRRATAEIFGMTIDQVRYLESKLRRGILASLREAGHLDSDAAEAPPEFAAALAAVAA